MSQPLTSPLATVVSSETDGAGKILVLDSGLHVNVPRFAVAGLGDRVGRDGRGAFVSLNNGKARLTPAYSRQTHLLIGGTWFAVTIKEIDRVEELEAYAQLRDLHYRGHKGFGRRAILVATSKSIHLPRVLAFVELTTGFLMNSPRTKIVDAPFVDGQVRWSCWRANEMRTLTSVFARVSRIVVHPELRGQGMGSLLIRAAAQYARSRFHAGGLRPHFLEMTADMAKFVPFAARGGMRYIGETQGNLHRIAADARYLASRQDLLNMPTKSLPARGIMQAQRGYVAALETASEAGGRTSVDATLAAARGSLQPAAYAELFGILRLPKPTYLRGLTKRADQFVERRIQELQVIDANGHRPSPVPMLSGPISVSGLHLAYSTAVPRTERTTQIQEAFGIRPESVTSPVLIGLSADFPPGSITLVTGPSGSGKTSLLKLLGGADNLAATITGAMHVPSDAVVGHFLDLSDDRPLIETIDPGGDVRSALYALNHAGLSDAKLYLRRYSELSNGQRHRAVLASLIASNANVWIADEFLSTLDRISAAAVANSTASHVRRMGITLIAGAPHFEYMLEALQPDLVLQLQSAWDHRLVKGEEFLGAYRSESQVRTRAGGKDLSK